MAAFFTFSQRSSQETNFSPVNEQGAVDRRDQQHTDPWNLGISTSNSTAETIGLQSSSDDTLLPTRCPPTPEGLRPRKSIQSIRKDVQECNHYAHETHFSYGLPNGGEEDSRPPKNHQDVHRHSSVLPIRKSFSSFGRQDEMGILPPSFQRIESSPIRSTSSFYEQSVEESNNFNDEDFDINSSMDDNFSRHSRRSFRSQKIAESPDLKSGGKPKTAVGALLVAMGETSAGPNKTTVLNENRYDAGVQNKGHQYSILPPRAWMDKYHVEDDCLRNQRIDEDDTIRDDFNQLNEINGANDDDNQSSLHASPSSLRRNILPASRFDRQQDFLKETSFTRRILNDEPSSSRIEDRTIIGHSPYDFNPITQGDIRNDAKRECIGAPHLLTVVNDHGRLNLSAISNSHHQRDFESINTSLADTIEEEEEEYREIPMYYQALADDAPAQNTIGDDVLLSVKAQNQRREKENLLRSVFERFQDSLDLLKEVYPHGPKYTSLFLGLCETKAGAEYCGRMQSLLSELQEGTSKGNQIQALLFCMSILQNTTSFSKLNFNSQSRPHWVSLPGFRSSLGLKEEPQSPQTIRGGDTSLFSLPSDSANNNTPHTSNVSMATTITTIVSPERYGSGINKQQQQTYPFAQSDVNFQEVRKTIESLARLLYRLEETCHKLKSRNGEKEKLIEDIRDVYYELLSVSTVDLRAIVNSFEMEFSAPQNLFRTVSNDNEEAAYRPPPSFHSMYLKESDHDIKDHVTRHTDSLCVNIDGDSRNQSIECDILSPSTNDMMSLISPESENDNVAATNNGYSKLMDDEQPVDDLRRTIGSFDDGNAEDEREGPPSTDEQEPDYTDSFPATFSRRVLPQRSKKSRFWKKRFLALKNRGRQVTAE